LHAHFEGATQRFEREHDARAWLAWHVAALYRMPPRKFPKLKTLLAPKRRRTQSWQEQCAVMDAWVMVTKRIEVEKKWRR